jgi:hypothetical protein
MTGSSFEQPPPPAHAALTASGYYADRTPVRGRWHVYPEMAAAGLWTTPTDLARFAIEIQETLAGKGHGVISPGMALQYVTEQKGGSGLGVAVAGTGRELRFSHGGRDEGFDALLVATAETGQGLAAMINANDNSGFMGRLQRLVARLYRWPGAPAAMTPAVRGTRLSRAALDRVAGYYEARENQMMALAPSETGEGVVTLTDGLPDETLLALDSLQFAPAERPGRMTFTADAGGQATGLTWRGTGPELRMPKVSPLPSSVTPAPDPDPALTERIRRVIPALFSGGPALAQEVDVTPGARQDFARGARPGATIDSLGYIGTADVTGRGLRRHGADVSRVRYYRVRTNAGPRYLLVHLTADGLVTDYDLVQR